MRDTTTDDNRTRGGAVGCLGAAEIVHYVWLDWGGEGDKHPGRMRSAKPNIAAKRGEGDK